MALNNVSRLGMRIQETLSERTRDMAIGRSSSAAYFDTGDDKVKNIQKQLDSNSDREKLDAMKRLIAMISKGRNVSEFFPLVVKNVASHNLEIRKLVYIYLLRYAEHEPDLALLSINTFQKDLTDPNPLIRAMALRVLSGIRVPMIGSLVVLGIKKCAADPSPYVRKAAALAIPKCYDLDNSHHSELLSILQTLLRDPSPLSIGSVAIAFNALCSERLDMLHQQFRRLCRILVDADEWGQINLLDLLARYARTMLSQPDQEEQLVEETGENAPSHSLLGTPSDPDPDLKLLLSSAEPLFQSRNPAVVFAVARIYWYLAPPAERHKMIRPLLRLMHRSPEVERVIVEDFMVISKEAKALLVEHYDKFFIRATDLSRTKRAKSKILVQLVSADNFLNMIREFKEYARDTDDDLVADSIRALGHCARHIPESKEQCLSILTTYLKSDQDFVVSNTVLVLKSLHQIQLASPTAEKSSLSIIARLARRLDSIRHPQARACVVWLVGQYAKVSEAGNGSAFASIGPASGLEGITEWAPDVLRKTAKTFADEADSVKLQIVNLSAKLLVLCPSNTTLQLLSRYGFSLARYDANYDIRDRGRMLSALLSGLHVGLMVTEQEEEDAGLEQGGVILRREQVELVLFGGKAPSEEEESWLPATQRPFGSISLITGKDIFGDRSLPDWPSEGTDPSLRETEEDKQPPPPPAWTARILPGISGPQDTLSVPVSPVILTPTTPSPSGSMSKQAGDKGAFQDLDSFYADEEESEEESEDDEESDIPNKEVARRVTAEVEEEESETESDSSEDGDHDLVDSRHRRR